jgi:hypothetical protein
MRPHPVLWCLGKQLLVGFVLHCLFAYLRQERWFLSSAPQGDTGLTGALAPDAGAADSVATAGPSTAVLRAFLVTIAAACAATLALRSPLRFCELNHSSYASTPRLNHQLCTGRREDGRLPSGE